MTASNQTFEEQSPRQGVLLVKLPERLRLPRSPTLDEYCYRWIDDNETVVIDASGTLSIVTRWLKFICILSERAKAAGKALVLVGISEDIRKSADYLALDGCFTHADSVDEALSP